MHALVDWLLSQEWFRNRLIELGWTPPASQNLAGGPNPPGP